MFFWLLQVQELPPELANAQITFKQFEDVAMMRRNRHLVTYALDFCAQVSTLSWLKLVMVGGIEADTNDSH